MEILDFLRIARRRLALLVLVPLVAVGAAVTLALIQPPMYSATATVDSPALVGGSGSRFTGSQGVNQYAAAFQATATGPSVGVVVADEGGISQTDLYSGLSVTRHGVSSTMIVTFTGERRDQVAEVVQAVGAQTLTVIFKTQVDAEAGRVEAARVELAKANAEIDKFGSENNVADPVKAYAAQLDLLNQLVQQQATLKANGNSVGAAAMESSITDVEESLAGYAPILAAYSNLAVNRDAALDGMTSAQLARQQATAQLAAADPEQLVYVSQPQRVGSIGPVLRTAVPVGAAALFMTILLVALMEVLARGREARSSARDAEAGPAVDTSRDDDVSDATNYYDDDAAYDDAHDRDHRDDGPYAADSPTGTVAAGRPGSR